MLQSTTFPGTTTGPFREVVERSGLRAGVDFDLAFAPERVNPGDPASASKAVPRLVGATTPEATKRAAALLRNINDNVVELSSPDAAELAKLLENVFRNVNIAFVNQLALLCERMGLDVWEVINAAATKPFGFMKFTPGPGVGGHCIPVDPYYLAWRAREFDFIDRFIELAGDINFAMPRHVVDLVAEALNDRGKALKGAKVGVLGVAFKPNVRDARNSPAADVIAGIAERGADVRFHDPHVDVVHRCGRDRPARDRPRRAARLGRRRSSSSPPHAAIDWPSVYDRAALVVDTVDSSTRTERRASGRSFDWGQAGRPGRDDRAGPRPVLMIVHAYYEEDPRVRRQAETLVATGRPVRGPRRSGGPDEPVDVRARRRSRPAPRRAAAPGRRSRRVPARVPLVLSRDRCGRRPGCIAAERFALVQVHSLPDFLVFAALPLRLVGVPVLLDLHEAMPEFFRSRFPGASNPFVHRLLRLQERLSIALSTRPSRSTRSMRDRLVGLGVAPDKVDVVMNSPSLARFDPSAHPRRPFREDGRLRLVYTGALTPTYELGRGDRRASPGSPRRRPDLDVALDVYGRGDSEPALRDQVERARARRPRHVPRPDPDRRGARRRRSRPTSASRPPGTTGSPT